MPVEDQVRQRIAMLRFLMIFGVVFLHVPPFVPFSELTNEPFALFKAYLQLAVFRCTVPVLTVISGYLLFRSAIDQDPLRLAKKKGKTILVPFLFFNLSLLAVGLALHHGLGLSLSNDLPPADLRGWLDLAIGYRGSPMNYPLNFLRDLLVLMLLAPVFGVFLRRAPWVGLVLVFGIFMNNFDRALLLRDVMAPVFYLGGLAAVRRWNLVAFDRFAWPALLAFLLACAWIVAMRVANTNVLRLVGPFLIWPAAALLVPTAFGRWMARMSKYSFFVFVAHAPVLLATWIAFKPFSRWVPYPVYWVLAPFVVVGLLVVIYRLLARFAPALLGAVLGTRVDAQPRSGAAPVAAAAPAGS
jgi:succinoglycan biosynthesis protein ExoH